MIAGQMCHKHIHALNMTFKQLIMYSIMYIAKYWNVIIDVTESRRKQKFKFHLNLHIFEQ